MSGAISNVTGLNTMNYSNLYTDPYFQQAFNSPNINAQQATVNQSIMGQQPSAQTISQPTVKTQATPSFKGASDEITKGEEKNKKSNFWKWALGAVAVAGLAWCGYKCYNKGTGEGLTKICDGAKKYLGGAKSAVKDIANGSKKANDVFTITRNGDDILCTVPGRTNVLRGENLTSEAIKKLGGSIDDISLTDKATQIMKYEAKLDDGSVITVMGNKLRSVVDKNGKKIALDTISEANNTQINKIIKGR